MKHPHVSTRFICRRCGACCRVPGPVRVTAEEIDRIAAHLGLPPARFIAEHTVLTADRRSLTLLERADGACEFLDDVIGCRLQDVKPRQCREFPLGWHFPGYEKICRGMRGTG